jgi:hypothetical protein
MEALQGHFRRSVENKGFDESSSAAIADVRSLMLEVVMAAAVLDGDEAPEYAVFFACFVRTLDRSDSNVPDAEGGSLCRGREGL